MIDLPHFGGVGIPEMELMTLKFDLSRDLCTVHLPTTLNHPIVNHSEDIVLTNKQTNKHIHKQTDFVENIHFAPL